MVWAFDWFGTSEIIGMFDEISFGWFPGLGLWSDVATVVTGIAVAIVGGREVWIRYLLPSLRRRRNQWPIRISARVTSVKDSDVADQREVTLYITLTPATGVHRSRLQPRVGPLWLAAGKWNPQQRPNAFAPSDPEVTYNGGAVGDFNRGGVIDHEMTAVATYQLKLSEKPSDYDGQATLSVVVVWPPHRARTCISNVIDIGQPIEMLTPD